MTDEVEIRTWDGRVIRRIVRVTDPDTGELLGWVHTSNPPPFRPDYRLIEQTSTRQVTGGRPPGGVPAWGEPGEPERLSWTTGWVAIWVAWSRMWIDLGLAWMRAGKAIRVR